MVPSAGASEIITGAYLYLTILAFLPPLALILCMVLLSWLLRSGQAHALALDQPNHRSLHTLPTPRVGGLGIMLGTLVAMVGVGELVLAVLTLGLCVVSWLDDRGGVAISVRLGLQTIAAVIWMTSFALSLWSLMAIVSVVWMANLFNFMDGSDGLAGGMALIGFGAYGVAAWMAGDLDLAILAAAIAAASLGFLRFNFPPASLFMGDVGSVALGFVAGALGYKGWVQAVWAWWFPLVVFSPFIVDATLTLLRRGLSGERVWQAHKEHYYQRLVRMGWGHRKTAIAGYALMLAAFLSALVMSRLPWAGQAAGLVAWLTVYAFLAWRIDHAWRLVGRE